MLERKKAIDAGWSQFSVFNHTSSPRLYEAIPEQLKKQSYYYIVLSHPCSLLHYDLELEPNLEVVVAKPIDVVDGNCTYGKNPRKLHIEIEGLGQNFELEQRDRCLVNREHIDKCNPAEITLEYSVARAICVWVVNRYMSSAFPDAFETRVSKSKSKLRKLFSSVIGQKCRSVYIILNEPLRDLEETEDYQLRIFFTLSSLDFQEFDAKDDDYNSDYTAFLKTLVKIFEDIDGVVLIKAVFIDDSKLTVAQVQAPSFMKWNFDFLSVATNSEITHI